MEKENKDIEKPSENTETPSHEDELFKKMCFAVGAVIVLGVLVVVGKVTVKKGGEIQRKMAVKQITAEAKAHCLKTGITYKELSWDYGSAGYKCEECRQYDDYFLNKYCEKNASSNPELGRVIVALSGTNCPKFKGNIKPDCFN